MNVVQTITILVCISALFGYLNHRVLRLPVTIGLMAIALAMSLILLLLGKLGFDINVRAEAFIRSIDFNEALMHGMLSCLLFAGALHVNLSDLLDQKWIVGTLASVGVVLSTFVIGGASYYLFSLVGLHLSFLYCLLFGALISPTDPVAVMGILKEARLPKPLEVKVVGESLFNDGVGVVVFLVLMSLIPRDSVLISDVVLLFVEEVLGGALLGILLGFGAYLMLKSVDNYQVEILITLALVMGGYELANLLHTSGPIAVVVAGLLIGNQGRRLAMSEKTREHLDAFWDLVDELLNAILFVLIGLEVLVLSYQSAYLKAGLVAIPLVLFTRFITVWLQVKVFSLVREFTQRAVAILTWGGLRGGISVALALSLPAGPARDAVLLITYTVVVFSILVQGLTIKRLIASPA